MTFHDWWFGVTEFWVGSLPVATGLGWAWKKVTERRHRDRLAQAERWHALEVTALRETKS